MTAIRLFPERNAAGVMQLSTKALLPTPGHALVPGTNYSPVRGLSLLPSVSSQGLNTGRRSDSRQWSAAGIQLIQFEIFRSFTRPVISLLPSGSSGSTVLKYPRPEVSAPNPPCWRTP